MKVVMLTYDVAVRSSSFIRAHSLARYLVPLGHEVSLVAAAERPSLQSLHRNQDGVRVIELADPLPFSIRHAGLSPIELMGRLKLVARLEADVVHAFGHRPTVSWTAKAFQKRGTPVIGDWADLWGLDGIGGVRSWALRNSLGRLDDRWEQQVYPSYDSLTTINSDLKRRAEALGIPSSRIEMMSFGADTDAIRPLPKEEMRRRRGLSPDRPIVLHLGLSTYDAPLLGGCFVETARRDPEPLFMVVGRPLRQVREAMAAGGFADRLFETGFVAYELLGEYLACGDVMVLPYSNRSVNRGRSPNKLGDYMAAGRPVVTNPTGEMRQLVEEAGIGLVADEQPKAMAKAILTLLRDPELRDRLGQQARKAAERRFSWRNLAERLALYYQTARTWRGSA